MDNIENIMQSTLSRMKEVIDVDNVIGSPIMGADGSTIIPISKVSLGFVTGAGEYNETLPKVKSCDLPVAGGAAGGVTITPLGFLIVGSQKQFISTSGSFEENKWTTFIKTFMEKIKKD